MYTGMLGRALYKHTQRVIISVEIWFGSTKKLHLPELHSNGTSVTAEHCRWGEPERATQSSIICLTKTSHQFLLPYTCRMIP